MSNRESYLTGLATGVVLLGMGILPGMESPPTQAGVFDVLTARKVVIVDAKGNERAVLFEDEKHGGELRLIDANEHIRMRLLTSPEASGLNLFDENGNLLLAFAGSSDGGAFTLHDGNGNMRVALAVQTDGGGLGIYQPDGVKRIMLRDSEAGGVFALLDNKARITAMLPNLEDED